MTESQGIFHLMNIQTEKHYACKTQYFMGRVDLSKAYWQHSTSKGRKLKLNTMFPVKVIIGEKMLIWTVRNYIIVIQFSQLKKKVFILDVCVASFWLKDSEMSKSDIYNWHTKNSLLMNTWLKLYYFRITECVFLVTVTLCSISLKIFQLHLYLK